MIDTGSKTPARFFGRDHLQKLLLPRRLADGIKKRATIGRRRA
jgi:hypothetical protein